jgi:hypothetical protein
MSADARTLAFTSTRTGGAGGTDLWVAKRASNWINIAPPVPLAGVNTTSDEEGGQLSDDQLALVFASTRDGGLGGLDLWLSTRRAAEVPFGAHVNLTD